MISVVGSPTTANTGSATPTSIACNVPTGTALNQLMLVAIGANLASTVVFASTGWTVVPNYTRVSANNNSELTLLYRVATASEPSSYTFSTSPTFKGAVVMITLAGVDLYNPFVGVNSQAVGTASTTATFPSATATSAYAYAMTFAASRTTGGATTVSTPSSGFSSVSDVCTTSAFIQCFAQYGSPLFGSPTPTVTPGNATLSQSANYSSATLLLRPANGFLA